jgi:hypothetical protein
MTTHQFMLRLEQPPTDEQVHRLLRLTSDVCVEVGAFRRWAAVIGDRDAPSLAAAIVATIRDLDSAGLIPIDSGPDDDIVSVPLIAERIGFAEQTVRDWALAGGGPCAFPGRADTPGPTEYYRWGDVVAWLSARLGFEPRDNAQVFTAINMAMRLRTILPCVEGAAAIRSLLEAG